MLCFSHADIFAGVVKSWYFLIILFVAIPFFFPQLPWLQTSSPWCPPIRRPRRWIWGHGRTADAQLTTSASDTGSTNTNSGCQWRSTVPWSLLRIWYQPLGIACRSPLTTRPDPRTQNTRSSPPHCSMCLVIRYIILSINVSRRFDSKLKINAFLVRVSSQLPPC